METLKFAFYITGTLFFVGMIIFFIIMAFYGKNEAPIHCDLSEKPNFYFDAVRSLQERNEKLEQKLIKENERKNYFESRLYKTILDTESKVDFIKLQEDLKQQEKETAYYKEKYEKLFALSSKQTK